MLCLFHKWGCFQLYCHTSTNFVNEDHADIEKKKQIKLYTPFSHLYYFQRQERQSFVSGENDLQTTMIGGPRFGSHFFASLMLLVNSVFLKTALYHNVVCDALCELSQ